MELNAVQLIVCFLVDFGVTVKIFTSLKSPLGYLKASDKADTYANILKLHHIQLGCQNPNYSLGYLGQNVWQSIKHVQQKRWLQGELDFVFC